MLFQCASENIIRGWRLHRDCAPSWTSADTTMFSPSLFTVSVSLSFVASVFCSVGIWQSKCDDARHAHALSIQDCQAAQATLPKPSNTIFYFYHLESPHNLGLYTLAQPYSLPFSASYGSCNISMEGQIPGIPSVASTSMPYIIDSTWKETHEAIDGIINRCLVGGFQGGGTGVRRQSFPSRRQLPGHS